MSFKFFLTTFLMCVTFSKGKCPDNSQDWSSGIPSECSDSTEAFKTPKNHICSISYLLYNEDNTDTPCYVEPKNQVFDRCEFNSYKPTKILIHGYTVQLKPGNVFEQIKDEILTVEDANVIIVNWTRYDNFKYNRSVELAYSVGIEVGKFINFLLEEKRVDPAKIHVIAHSLGAHVAGVAGKKALHLGRISGLDPAAPSFDLNVTYNRLTASDAIFVDVIHCSNGVAFDNSIGQGIPSPIGDINFYPNGGVYQPYCKIGRNYSNADGVTTLITSQAKLKSCRHDICPFYFLFSIRDCKFRSKECSSYKRYNKRKCSSQSHPEDLMEFYAEPIPGLKPHSKFYLNTTADPPFCLNNCDSLLNL